MDWRQISYVVIGLFIGVVFHEYMHARIADWLGDKTARSAGRLTLNPVPHIDPFGTILVPLALVLISQGRWIFGYAKPVPVNPFFMKKPRRDMMLVALAGPMTNFALGFALALVGMVLRLIGVNTVSWFELFSFFYYAAYINVFLGIFNLLPLPPLDGSHILEYFLPPAAQRKYEALAPYSFLIIIAVLWILGPFLFRLLNPVWSLLRSIVFGF